MVGTTTLHALLTTLGCSVAVEDADDPVSIQALRTCSLGSEPN